MISEEQFLRIRSNLIGCWKPCDNLQPEWNHFSWLRPTYGRTVLSLIIIIKWQLVFIASRIALCQHCHVLSRGIMHLLSQHLIVKLGLAVPRGNVVINSTLDCCAGGPGSIPAVGQSNVQYSDGFSPSWYKLVGERNGADTLCVL